MPSGKSFLIGHLPSHGMRLQLKSGPMYQTSKFCLVLGTWTGGPLICQFGIVNFEGQHLPWFELKK